MRSRWLSTFTAIGALLIVLGIIGLILGHRFVFDPGQPANGREPWYYLIIGALMVLNGLLTPAATEERNKQERSEESVAPARKAGPREAIATVADKSSRD